MSRPRRFVARLLLLCVWTEAVTAGVLVFPERAEARVDPLEVVTAQIKKANGLVVLDTSGSMTGVAGEIFGPSSEVGVDCDNGRNCRFVDKTGQCSNDTTRSCSGHDDCRHGWCSDGVANLGGGIYQGDLPCYKDADCPVSGGTCESTGQVCQYDSDCVAPATQCPLGGVCSASVPCPTVGRCTLDGVICGNVDQACTGGKRCSNDPARTCSNNTDCGSTGGAGGGGGAGGAGGAGGSITAGLVALFDYDEGTGTQSTDQVGGGTVQYTGPITWAPGHSSSAGGYSVDLNTTGYGSGVASAALDAVISQLTLATWAYWKTPSGNDQYIMARVDPGRDIWNLRLGPGGGLCAGLTINGSIVTGCSLGVISPGQWVHIALTWDGSVFRFFINGTADANATSAAGTLATDPTVNLALGGWGLGGNTFDGRLDDTKIYNRALSASEIAQLAAGSTANGLVANWQFEENAGTTASDTSGNSNNLAAIGTPAPTWQPGRGAGTYAIGTGSANGMAGAANGSLAALTDTSGVSLAAWANLTSYGAGASTLISRPRTAGGYQYRLYVSSTGALVFQGSTGSISSGPGTVPAGTWVHAAATYGSGSVTLYVNGSAVGAGMLAAPITTDTTPIIVGTGDNPVVGSDSFPGAIDEVQIYNRALSSSEIATLVGTGGGDLVGKWSLDENSGAIAGDSSGNGNAGTLVSGAQPTWVALAKSGPGLQFNGSQYVSVATSNSLNTVTGSLTLAAWTNRTGSVAGWQHVLNRSIGQGPFEHYALGFLNDRLAFLNSGSNPITMQSPNVLSAGAWHHVAVTWDGININLYEDGVNVALAGWVGAPQPDTGPLTIGADLASGSPEEFFTGQLDEIYLYKRALSPAEIATLAGSAVTPGGAGTCLDRVCQRVDNICPLPSGPNHCRAASVNRCGGVNSSATCQEVLIPGGAAPARMCEVTQKLCTTDAQCPSGDRCVPATSRAVIAKRTIRSLLLENYEVVNFGMMTFHQQGYFPYYTAASPVTSQTAIKFFTREQLAHNATPCYDPATGPSATCTVGPVTYSLAPAPNSRYQVQAQGNVRLLDQDHCGEMCSTAAGTGLYLGSYYQYAVAYADYDASSTATLRPQYEGRVTSVGGAPYVYFKPRTDYYYDPQAGTNRPPIRGVWDCGTGNSCSPTCGAGFDPATTPAMSFADDPVAAAENVLKFLPQLEPAEEGGLFSWERSPLGCALYNDNPGASPEQTSVYHHLAGLKAKDTLDACRTNFVVVVTDGQPTGPGELDPTTGNTLCDNPDCALSDPTSGSCQCRAVLSAYRLNKQLGVKTYVVGFGREAELPVPHTVNDNIARAGGTSASYLARNEKQLQLSIRAAVYDAIRGSYSTSPATASSGTQGTNSVSSGQLVLDARADFPAWKGNLIAYDVSGAPAVAWNAATSFDPSVDPEFWKKRRVYTSNGPAMVKVEVDAASGDVVNKDQLFALGLGANAGEAALIARWMLGDPTLGNPAVLGAMINSTPTDVGQPGANPLPGGKRFYAQYKDRPNLTYVGADDGMLHAFFTKGVSVGGRSYPAGSEAFAYIPPEMLRVITRLYTQGGQLAHPSRHIFGLATSPKVHNQCVANCSDDAGAQWKTILTMGDGYGGSEKFMLDITSPVDAAGIQDPPVSLLWHSGTDVSPGDADAYDKGLGQTASVAAFYLGSNSDLADSRIVFTSGYAARGAPATQGLTLFNARALDGTIIDADSVSPTGGCDPATQPATLLTDVAVARNYQTLDKMPIVASYFGDTWGNLYRYVPDVVSGTVMPSGSVTAVDSLGCQQPLHFSPTVVQLDRDDPANHAREIYLVQATNSPLDPVTRGYAARSALVIRRDLISVAGGVTADTTLAGAGLPRLTIPTDQICASYTGTLCNSYLPATARPSSTPTAVLRSDGSGFQIYSVWYVPTNGCAKGTTYFAVHELTPGATLQVVQKGGLTLANEPVAGTVVVNGKLVFVDSQNAVTDITGRLGIKFAEGGSISYVTRNGGLRFQTTGWTELP